ncbi:MAG: DUF4342 domain-containing protein [Chloroflexaceae bacterium]|nr:DUF4342 domain-containing protein [Chloroflexaceae bacterium]
MSDYRESESTQTASGNTAPERTLVQEFEVAGSQLINSVRELIASGNVHHLVIRSVDGKLLLEIPVTAGLAIGGVVTLFTPLITALAAIAAMVSRVKIEVVRIEQN